MSEDITQKNAQNCKNYRRRKKTANHCAVNKKTNSEYCRTYRQRKKILALELKSENEVLDTASTSSLKMTFEPQPITNVGNDTIESEMEEGKEQTDTQTDEKIWRTNTTDVYNDYFKNRKINELDKFKRRMIRAIARLLHTEKKAEADIWDDLKNETGCDCELLWSRMRALTIKKLLRLFTAEDKIKNIAKTVQLSVTDWLLYDLVLVHEKVDVIGQELHNKEEPSFLRDLFNLVEEFNIEYARGEELIEKWFEATAKYNNTGKRQCSPMLLQKRWYQLKERSRSNFYNFWFQYGGDSRKLEKANEFKPSDLQLDIVKRYKEIVTKPFLNWEVLVKEGKVALPEDFERLRLARNKITIGENELDIEVIEQHVETIDLDETNDSNDSVNKDTCNHENDFNIDIVKVESLAEQDDDVSVLESVHIPLERSELSEINSSDADVETTNSTDDNDLEIIKSDLEQFMPKIASVTSTAYLESTKDKIPEESSSKEIIDIKDYETQAESGQAVNIILEQLVKNVVENNISKNLDEKTATTSKEKVLNLDKDIEVLNFNVNTDLDVGELKSAHIHCNDKNSAKSDLKYQLYCIDFDDFSNNLNFIDDGIEFVDDGIEYMDEDNVLEYKIKPVVNSEIIEPNEEDPKIDLKLLLTPVVYTKKLDDMDVFRFIDYNTVKDDRVLQNAARESKPEDNKSIDMKTMLQECNQEDFGRVASDSGDVIPEYDVTISSWLFQKPKVNDYNPIQLCKNPDFNTRLKRLAAAFYTSERNRMLLKQCKPLTVDLHKTFESELINNTLYLKNTKSDTDMEITDSEMIATSCKTELPETIEPSTDNNEHEGTMNAADEQISIEQTSEIHTERNKVINLPDIEQIRRVNQGLLVAEVSPIQVTNPVNQTNIKPTNNVLNTVESETTLINSSATDEEIIKIPSNACEFALETDKVIAVSDNDNSKVTNKINDIEQTETVSQLVKNYKRHTIKSLFKQSVPKYKTKSATNKYMQLSWLPKLQTIKTDAIDCLLAADTVERILSLCKDDYISLDPKVHKPKKKKKGTGVTDKTGNQVPAVKRKYTIKEKKTEKEKQIPKKSKCRISITTQTTNIKNVCCWSRQKVNNFTKLNTGKHYCPHNRCVCCCKADLEAKILAIEEERKRSELIILSDDEPITVTSAKTHHPNSKVTKGTNTDYDKDFEEQFAANLSIIKDNVHQVQTPIISLPFSDLPPTFSNESGCQTLSPSRIVKPLPPATLDHKVTAVTSTHKHKPKVPISLGKNKLLLCSFKTTAAKASPQKNKKYNQNIQTDQLLPEGCHLVLLPNRELALSIDPGVELDASQLSKLPLLIAAVQKQVNTLPTTENIIDSQKVTLNEETVINLSDDGNTSIKDNAKNNLDINVSSTSNSSPTAMYLDSSNASAVTDVAAISKDDKQIPIIDLNSYSSLKESCNIPELVPINNSTETDTGDVFIESSTNNNSTNNTEDASGVNKKTILSDLMEMSGISADDIILNNDGNIASNDGNIASNDGNVASIDGNVASIDGNVASIDGNVASNDDIVASNDGIVTVNVNCTTDNQRISIIQQVLPQSDNYTSDLQREYAAITRSIGINPIMENIVVRAALLRCPELNIVSSFLELKYAYENEAQFFRMDIVSGIIVPINVCIKQDLEVVKKQLRKGISKVQKSVIDLTDDNEIDTYSSNFQTIQSKITIHEPSESREESSQDMIQDKNNSPLKPIKMFKAVHPSILRYNGRSLLENSSVLRNKIVRPTKHKTKQGLNVKSIDLDQDNKLKTHNNPTNTINSDSESDEEPLAKKAKRLKDNLERETKNKTTDPSLDVDSDKAAVRIDINHELPPRLEPIVFEDNSVESSDDDCILGV